MSDLDKVIDEFEQRLLDALKFKYRGQPDGWIASRIEISPVTKIDIGKFRELYLAQNVYPVERLEKLVYLLMDVKIQLFYLVELDLGLYNYLIADQGFTPNNINKYPYVVLRKLSLDQNLIVKSRILWERVMNFIYFLETGKDLEVKNSSKKSRFFKFATTSDKWAFLEDYKSFIDWFDDSLRTPEVHKGSVLRRHFMTDTNVPDDKIAGLLNIVMNVFWPSLIEILQGEEFRGKFWFPGMDFPGP